MRILFIIQGEGRGHLTQAISLAQILQAAGHEVVGAWVNVAGEGTIPGFFADHFPAPFTPLPGPALVYNPETNVLDWKKTLWGMVSRVSTFQRSLRQLRDAIRAEKPDVVVNFFELLGGLTYGLYRPSAPMVCVGHQCMAFHTGFPFPAGRWLDRLLFKGLVHLNAWRATELFGLSFDEQPDEPRHRLRVMPPLLRREATSLAAHARQDAYVLAYTTQPGLMSEVLQTHRIQPQVPIRYFHALATHPEEPIDDTLLYCRFDSLRYLHAIQHCRAVMTTAGFESVCEALYQGKPVQMRPQPNHYEQSCNALDGQRAGAGMVVQSFGLTKLLAYLPVYQLDASRKFRAWHATGSATFVHALQRIADRSLHPAIAFVRPGTTSAKSHA